MEKSKLSKNEMKKIMGGVALGAGSGGGSCTATAKCKGTPSSITITCTDGQACEGSDYEYVRCTANNRSKVVNEVKCSSNKIDGLMGDAGALTMTSMSAPSMLAQANAVPQSVLSLLN